MRAAYTQPRAPGATHPKMGAPQPRGDTAGALPAGLAAPGGRGAFWARLSPACLKPGPSSSAPLPPGGSKA